MAERTMKTRISLLTKSYSEWQTLSTFVPLKGEMCIVQVPAQTGAVVSEPAVLFKIGDGTHTFAELSYSSALAADIYSWAKKENLDWSDMSSSYKTSLKEYIESEITISDTLYQIVADGSYKWKLQKSTDHGATWVDATGNIDVSALVTELNKKVNTSVAGSNGTALIFNETDGGGAKFDNNDGSMAFVGVNDAGLNGIMAQIYAVKPESGVNIGSRINVYRDAIYYINKENNEAGYSGNNADMEIVVKKDIKNLAGALHFIGATTKGDQETYLEAINRLMTEKSHTPVSGDIVIIKTSSSSKEFIYDGSSWIEIGDEDMYATKAALNQEIAERKAADATKVDITDTLILDCNL